MARVTGFTAERMLEIERNTVINAFRNDSGELIFTTYDGRQINVGNLEGRGIVQTDIAYQVSPSGSETPVGVWQPEVPELTPGIFLWTRTTLHYTDDTTSVMYSVARIGEDGTPGDGAQFPMIPSNLRVKSNVGVFTDQGPMAEITLEWDPVTQSTDGDYIELSSYELYEDSYSIQKIASGTEVTILKPSGSSTLFRVLANSKAGVSSDLGPALSVVAATPGLILRDPNTPIVDSDQGVVTVRWDGSYLGTQNNDSASHVVVGIQNGSSWIRHGVPLYEMGTVNIASKPKTNVTAKLFAYDRLGRLTGESEAVTVTVEGTPFSSFDDVTQEYLEGIEIQAQNAWNSASAAVKSTMVEYAVGSSEIIAPSSGWSSDTPERTPGSFIWMRTTVTYGDDSTDVFSPVLLTGNDGASGSPGRSITDVDVMYYSSTSTTTLSGGSWQTTSPAWAEGRYIWTKTVTVYSTGDPTETDPVCITGDKGDDGDDGVGVASIVEEYYLSTSATTQSGGSWGTSVPGWVDGRYYWTRSKITYTNGTVDTTTPKNVTGGKGSTGATGVSVTSVTQFYQVLPMASPAPAKPANSVATPPSPWQLTEPDYVEDTNLWVVTRVNFSNSTRSYSEVSKVSAYTAASTAQKTNMKILRTVDGLNRVFVSEESPGRGYIGYENLASEIISSGSWGEIKRNHSYNPRLEINNTDWYSSSSTGRYAVSIPELPQITHAFKSNGAIAVGATRPVVNRISELVAGRTYTATFYTLTNNSNWRLGVWDGHVSTATAPTILNMAASNNSSWVEQTVTFTAVSTTASIGIYANASMSDVEYGVTAMCVVQGSVPYSYFDGTEDDNIFGVNIRTVKHSTGASSMESLVMDIEHTANQITPLVSEHAPDGTSMSIRVIRNNTAAIAIPVTNAILTTNQTYTLRMLVKPIGKTQYVIPRIRDRRRAGETIPADIWTPIEYVATASTGSNLQTGLLLNSNPDGVGDEIYLAKTEVYKGTLPDDAEPLHNGDLWFRTGWKTPEVGESTYGVQEVLIWNGQDWTPYKLVVDSLAAANSVTTAILNVEEIWGNSAWLDQLEVGVITTNMLSSKFGEDLDISSNSSITLMVGDGTEANPGRLSELDVEIGKVDSKVEETTNLITGDDGINAKINNLNALTDKIQAAFRIETDKVSVVAVEGAPNRLDIYPDAIRMVSGEVTVAEITQEHIEIKAGKFTEAVIGNHLMKTTPDGRTIFTPKNN